MFLFYAPQIEDLRCLLSPAESRHCAKVLRLREGEKVWVTDGQGSMFAAELDLVNDKCCAARIVETLKTPAAADNARPQVHIVMAPTKNIDRTEWFLEKATEVGLGRITFIRTEHSERKIIKEDRVEAILLAAMKQSQQAWLPLYGPMVGLKDYLAVPPAKTPPAKTPPAAHRPVDTRPVQKFIAYCGPEYPRAEFLDVLSPDKPYEVMIGPEGDFSPAEVAECVKNGYIPVSLGPTRLRTETAALFAAWAGAYKKAGAYKTQNNG